MIRSTVLSAFGAAVLVGLTIWILQIFTTEPLILEAELYEIASTAAHTDVSADSAGQSHDVAHEHDHADGGHATAGQWAWSPADGLGRSLFTLLANVVTAFGVAIMVLGAMTFAGSRIDALRGLSWGIAGFAAFSLLPSLGLPPELPGTPAAPIESRQVWWLATVAVSAVGLGLLLLVKSWWGKAAGLLMLVAPHIIGAPPPPHHEVPYPGALAGEFAVASIAVSAALWCLAGILSGWFHHRLAIPAEPGR